MEDPTPAAETLARLQSERYISTLQPDEQPKARALLQDLNRTLRSHHPGVHGQIVQGTRPFQEQDWLYAQGRTRPGQIVTNARGGESNHNYGIAFDVGLFERGRYLANHEAYKLVGEVAARHGLRWGGNFAHFRDVSHVEDNPANLTVRQLRQLLPHGYAPPGHAARPGH